MKTDPTREEIDAVRREILEHLNTNHDLARAFAAAAEEKSAGPMEMSVDGDDFVFVPRPPGPQERAFLDAHDRLTRNVLGLHGIAPKWLPPGHRISRSGVPVKRGDGADPS